jgi:hypothetical protein
MFINEEKKIIFIRIPKTASSSISRTLNWKLLTGRAGSAHGTKQQIEKVIDTTGYKWVTFVRNPYSRFQSIYFYLLSLGRIVEPPVLFARKLFEDRDNMIIAKPMCYFCKTSDLHDYGRVENLEADLKRMFKIENKIYKTNKSEKPYDIYEKFPEIRNMVTRLYFEDFIEFKYEMYPILYKEYKFKFIELVTNDPDQDDDEIVARLSV